MRRLFFAPLVITRCGFKAWAGLPLGRLAPHHPITILQGARRGRASLRVFLKAIESPGKAKSGEAKSLTMLNFD